MLASRIQIVPGIVGPRAAHGNHRNRAAICKECQSRVRSTQKGRHEEQHDETRQTKPRAGRERSRCEIDNRQLDTDRQRGFFYVLPTTRLIERLLIIRRIIVNNNNRSSFTRVQLSSRASCEFLTRRIFETFSKSTYHHAVIKLIIELLHER